MLKGLCDICGKPAELFVCRKCGRRVCAEHYDKESGLCSICKSAVPKGRGQKPLPHGQLVPAEKPTTVSPGDAKK